MGPSGADSGSLFLPSWPGPEPQGAWSSTRVVVAGRGDATRRGGGDAAVRGAGGRVEEECVRRGSSTLDPPRRRNSHADTKASAIKATIHQRMARSVSAHPR